MRFWPMRLFRAGPQKPPGSAEASLPKPRHPAQRRQVLLLYLIDKGIVPISKKMDTRINSFPKINNTSPATGQRRRFLRLGIQMKVVLVLATSLLITLTIGGWLALQIQKQDILQETNIRGKEVAHFVANALTNSVVSYDYHAIELLLEETVKNEDIVYTKVLSTKGNIMAEVNDSTPNPGKVVAFSEDIRVDSEGVGKLILGMSVERTATTIRRQTSKLIQRELLTIFLIALIEFL